ncbi:MAG TPA: Crp/Fnr family transcriptional regulator [Steroidobacteraceae bacterium]|nr:Crp/Fnr family transcriptional regulator [Steroidobacteraceae bacterium]
MTVSPEPDLDRHPFLASVPPALMALAGRCAVEAGDVLFRIGDVPRSMLYVTAGEIQLVRRGRDGNGIVLQRSRGGFVAEASIDATAYHCDAVASTAAEVILFPIVDFRAALDADRQFHSAWSNNLARVVRTLRAQCERLSLKTAAERIIHYLESEGEAGAIVLTQSRKAWATEMGLTHEALYRTLKRLEAEGVVEASGNRVALRYPSSVRPA